MLYGLLVMMLCHVVIVLLFGLFYVLMCDLWYHGLIIRVTFLLS